MLETSGGMRLTCSHATLTGTLTSNDAQVITASFTAGSFWSQPEFGCERYPTQVALVEYGPSSGGSSVDREFLG